MSTTITNNNADIEFQFGSTTSRTRRVSKDQIQSIETKRRLDGMYVYLHLSGGSNRAGRNVVPLKYEDVSSPTTNDADALVSLLYGYKESSTEPAIFTATAGQTDFDTSSYFDIVGTPQVFVNGVYQNPDSGLYSVSGNVVTFAVGLAASTEVIVLI